MRGLTTICGAGSAGLKDGFAVHIYTASVSMDNCCMANADGDMLIVPQQGETAVPLPFTPTVCTRHMAQWTSYRNDHYCLLDGHEGGSMQGAASGVHVK